MVAEIRKKFRSDIAAQAARTFVQAQTPLTSAYTGTTLIDISYDGGSENGLGCEGLSLTFHCTAAPSATASAQIWYREATSTSQADVTRWRFSHTIGESIITSTAAGTTEVIYDAGVYIPNKQVVELTVAAVTADFSGHLDATPFVYEAQ